MRTYQEKFNYELNKMVDRDSQKRFFSGAINRMKLGYNVNWIDDQKEFACDVLCHCGFCLNVNCERCILEHHYNRAIEEIRMGVRRPAERSEAYTRYRNYITR